MLISLSGIVYSQDVTQIAFLSELDKKSSATYGDALVIFKLQGGGSAKISAKNDPLSLKGYTEKDTLTKGMASLMAARYLDLKGSLMYRIFHTQRYAYRACIAGGIFSGDGSENDRMSGPELIEMLSKISDIKGGK